ncbi:MAG: hypothetical protein CM1200mP8_1250 [Chloroflexota bacterium]|nr:MAG: hypothetical protein CM1200mP8_1250 [Chloroflexota bacterium]
MKLRQREESRLKPDLATSIVKNKWDLLRLEAVGMSLEEIFLRLTTSEDPIQDKGKA